MKISIANKGKLKGRIPWNKGKKIGKVGKTIILR